MAEHPITPPPELVRQWAIFGGTHYEDLSVFCQNIATKAARWGADAELEACCEWLNREVGTGWGHGTKLRAARRPKPPSLAEEALDTLETKKLLCFDHPEGYNIIHRALKRLQELEDND